MKRRWRRILLLLLFVLLSCGAILYRYPLWVADQYVHLHLWRSGVQSSYVSVDGYRIHYFEALPPGRSAGIPLLLVHGLGARGEDWSPMIPTLAAKGFHVYVPDLLGYGRSSRPDVSYSIALEEKMVVDFMRALNLQHADVAGWSMGGWVAMKIALDQPEMVDRLVLYDSAGIYFPGGSAVPAMFRMETVADVRRLLKVLTPKPMRLPDFAAQDILRKVRRNGWIVQRSLAAMSSGRDLLDFRLHLIRQPTLVVWGAHDDLIPLAAGETIHRSIPRSSIVVLEGCGHLAPSDCSRPVLRATIEFLRSDPPASGVERRYPAEP